jgi:hypothetical protein
MPVPAADTSDIAQLYHQPPIHFEQLYSPFFADAIPDQPTKKKKPSAVDLL